MARTRQRTEEIVSLKSKGLTNKEISTVTGMSLKTVLSNLAISEADKKEIAQFNKELPDHLSKLIGKLTNQLAISDLSKASPYQIAGMLSLLIDKQRLITGQSTSNQAVLFHLVSEACRPNKDSQDKDYHAVGEEEKQGGGEDRMGWSGVD